MGAGRTHPGVWLGALASACLHIALGIFGASVQMGAGSDVHIRPARGLDGPLVQLDFTDPPPDAAAQSPERESPPPDAQPKPPLIVVNPTPTLEDLERKLVLGIEESDQKTENWLGFNKPTPHSAPLSDVEQPQLETNPGSPGLPSLTGAAATPMQGPVLPQVLPTPSATPPPPDKTNLGPREQDGSDTAEPAPTTKPNRPDGEHLRDGRPDVPLSPSTKPGRDGIADATGEKLVVPTKGQPTPADVHPDPNLPGAPPKPTGPTAGADTTKLEKSPAATPRKIEDPRASSPPERPAPKTSVNPAVPTEQGGAPDTPATPPMPPSPASGSGGARPGEKSEKEADASSKTPAIEIRPGMPAAAQGLDITTKRPYFTTLTRTTAWPSNPLLKVTFNRSGIVTHVRLVESSGVSDVDGPVINAIYQWTAKGKILAELPPTEPNGGITISVRILLR